MSDSQQIVNKAWNFAHVLRDDGLSYMAYTEQITFLLFLKMAEELTRFWAPLNICGMARLLGGRGLSRGLGYVPFQGVLPRKDSR